MTEIITGATSILSFLTTSLGSIATTVLATPLLLIPFCVGFTTLGVKMLKRLMRV